MSNVVVRRESDGDWNVWITLDDHDPLTLSHRANDAFGFVVGVGTTRDEAVADAVQDLEAVIERLQQPPAVLKIVEQEL